MPFEPEPYRTLGLAPDASVNEIRSAYRRLAKQYHPDTAGERALSRFLAIQAAYERLVDDDGQLRRTGIGSGASRETGRSETGRGTRASRDAWRARRAGGTGGDGGRDTGAPAGPQPGEGTGHRTRERPGEGPRERAGEGAGGRRGEGHRGDDHHRRTPRRASPGSTSYDEAAEIPLDPAWDGGAWYGPSSGTFWTINPREYADPRKHGPEYLARARRDAGPADDEDDGRTDREPRPDPSDQARRPEPDTRAPAAGAPHRTAPSPTARPSMVHRLGPLGLLAVASRPRRRWAVLLALLGWPPLGIAVGMLTQSVAACGRFAAPCAEPFGMLPLLVQPIIILGLVLLPAAAAVAAFASIASILVAGPAAAVAAVAVALEGAADPASAFDAPGFVGVVGATYVIMLVIGIARVGRARDAEDRERPPSS